MDGRTEKINALLLDNRFVDWVLNPLSPYAQYWLLWIASSAENAAAAEEAKLFLHELRIAATESEKEVDEAASSQLWSDIKDAIGRETINLNKRPRPSKSYWFAAAAILAVILLSAILFLQQPLPQPATTLSSGGEKIFSAEVIRYNGSEKNELFFLPDGSKITLAKGARVVYNRLMNGNVRNIHLTGIAFFDVAKNPDKPFYIYTPKMVVKVLGTSLRVTASGEKESVVVKTGKVSVYLKDQDLEQSAPKILLPQQTCTYSLSKKELIKANYTSRSKIELETDNMPDYHFEDAPIDTVFKALETMYSLPVHYDARVLKNCFITISLGSESLEEKLEIITKTIGASFSISDYGINIEGKGCL